jgi:hypothetical protein
MGVTLMIPCISKAEEAKEAKDVKELIKMYDSKECETCHADYVADWKHSLHSKPLIGPFGKTLGTLQGYLKEREDTVKEKDKPERPGELRKSKEVTKSIKEFMMPCFICHIPQLQDASEQAAQQIADAVLKEDDEILEELTINCLICHNRQALPRKYRDGNPEKDAIYGVNKTGKHQAPSYPKMIKSEMMKDPAFCGGCHQGPNVLHSAEPMWCVSNYDSYLQSYIPQGGDKTCQNCHMEKTDYNKTGHRFPPNYDDKELSYKRLRDSIKFDVSAMAYIFQIKTPKLQSIPKAIVRTKVSHNVAHRFPDGCPSPTHFLLEVSIKDKDGKELQKYTKYYMPQKKLGYDENKMVFASLRKLSLMRDTSLQPFKDNVEEFEYDLPEGVKDIKVEAKLTFIVEPGVDSSIFELYKVEKEAHIGEPKEAAK